MAIDARLDLRMTQKLVMTPQLQMAIKLLQLSRLELEQAINQELMENPVLEEVPEAEEGGVTAEIAAEEATAKEVEAQESNPVDPESSETIRWDEYFSGISGDGRDMGYGAGRDDDEQPSYERTLTQAPSLADHLEWQLRLSTHSDKEKAIGRVIIGNIDDDGYLRVPLEEVAEMTSLPLAEIEGCLALIQQFDPPGVGARNLAECLLLQIRQLGLEGTLVESIVRSHMPNLERKRYQVIAKDLKTSLDKVIQAVKIVEGLEPKPGRPFFKDDVYYIIPDVYIAKVGEEYAIFLNEEGVPRLRTSNYYRDLVKEGNGGDPATKDYLDDRFRSAQWLIKSIEQRNKTIYKVAESILKLQRDFFDRGINYLKPMVLRDVAEDVGMHESTISRVTTSKYMHTPQGLFEFKFFFSSGLQSSAEGGVSSVSVKEMLRKIVAEEDARKPYNDQDLVKILKSKGVDIARRTVVKYRSELNIPSSNMRKREF